MWSVNLVTTAIPLTTTACHIIVDVCCFGKFIVFSAILDRSSSSTATYHMDCIVSVHGALHTERVDNSLKFHDEFSGACAALDTMDVPNSPWYSKSNGWVERFNWSITSQLYTTILLRPPRIWAPYFTLCNLLSIFIALNIYSMQLALNIATGRATSPPAYLNRIHVLPPLAPSTSASNVLPNLPPISHDSDTLTIQTLSLRRFRHSLYDDLDTLSTSTYAASLQLAPIRSAACLHYRHYTEAALKRDHPLTNLHPFKWAASSFRVVHIPTNRIYIVWAPTL